MIITIGGMPGAGKTLVGRMLAEKLGYRFYSVGDMQGKKAVEMGMEIDEFNKASEGNKELDRQMDELQKEMGMEFDDMVVDGRVSFHFIPKSFKVFLEVSPQRGAERIFAAARTDEKREITVDKTRGRIEERFEGTVERLKKLYGVDILQKKNYDLDIQTDDLSPEEVVEKIIASLSRHNQ